jgi:hypothetical protein
VVYEVGYMQAVRQRVVDVNRYRHGAATVRLSHLAEGYPRRGIFVGKVSRMRNGGEVEPRQRRITNQIGFRVPLEVVPRPHTFYFHCSVGYEFFDALTVAIVSESDGAVRTPNRAATIDLFITPGLAVDDTGAEVFNLLRGCERTMQKGEKDGEVVLLCVAVGCGAVYTDADAMVGLAERLEKVEERAAFPGVQIDFLLSYEDGVRHTVMLTRPPFEKHFHEGFAELQIPPLRYASVGMTKGRVVFPSCFAALDANSRSLHFATVGITGVKSERATSFGDVALCCPICRGSGSAS